MRGVILQDVHDRRDHSLVHRLGHQLELLPASCRPIDVFVNLDMEAHLGIGMRSWGPALVRCEAYNVLDDTLGWARTQLELIKSSRAREGENGTGWPIMGP